jgi:poly-gamma-glutamate synthesis protein (capsule biosynthesis protein)
MMSRSTLSFLIILVLLAACQNVPATPAATTTPAPAPQVPLPSLATVTPHAGQESSIQEFVGRVVTTDGAPIGDAQVETSDGGTFSDQEGWFQLAGPGLPQWIKVTAPGFISRTRAAAPGIPVLFRLTPDDGKTTVIHFAGDTMFGRRFFDPNGDGSLSNAILPLQATVNDHLRLLAPVKPLLENADFTVVNFETTVSDQPYVPQITPRPAEYHPTAPQVYTSHPNSVRALKEAGVDIVDLGNNHLYDLLEVGLQQTLSALDNTGLLHFGAGLDEAKAWEPLIVSSKGQNIAFIGCTTLRIPIGTPIRNDIPYVASSVRGKGGAAYCAEGALRSAILRARKQSDLVVVMIHGGREYDRQPTLKNTYLSEVARQAGAVLIVNHHPHVVSGFRLKQQTLIAWSMGNFFYDQTVWPSLESYMLAVYVREGQVIRAYIEPLMLDGFVPHGVTGELADHVARGAAGREAGPFFMESGSMEVDFGRKALQHTYTEVLKGGSWPGQILAIPQGQWISGFGGSGQLRLGRDLLWVGGFENEQINSLSEGPALWDIKSSRIPFGGEYAYSGSLGIRLSRDGNDNTDAVTSSLRRVTVEPYDRLSITGMVRMNYGAVVHAQFSWYTGTLGTSFSKTLKPIKVDAYDAWHPFRFDVVVPPGAHALGLYLRLALPGREEGKTTADFDNVRIIKWAEPGMRYSPLYNFALLIGTGKITLSQDYLPGAEAWLTTPVSAFEQNK